MTPPVGFVILSHNKPGQLRRLIDRLLRMFPDAPIVGHHDFAQCPTNVEDLPKQVSFVRPSFSTGWAEFSVVEATVSALRELHSRKDAPEWTFVLSGSDYPIQPASRILQTLADAKCDAFILHELIDPAAFQRDWQRSCYVRYCSLRLHLPLHTRLPSGRWSVRFRPVQFRGSLANLFLPFSARFRCYAGSQWFTVNGKAVDFILSEHPRRRNLVAHYRSLLFAEESYFQCILANSEHLVLRNENQRFIDWSENRPNPKTLTSEDLPGLLASDALFARKFDADRDSTVLDTLDEVIFTDPRSARSLSPEQTG